MNNTSTISITKSLPPAETQLVGRIKDKRKTLSSFVFREKVNRIYLLVALVGMIIQFIVLKILYPFPDFFILNFTFSIFANITFIRYQVFPMLLFVPFGLISPELLLALNGKKQLALSGTYLVPAFFMKPVK